MTLRDALACLPAVDLPPIIRQLALTPGSAVRRELLGELAEWGPHEENTARLLEVQSFQLERDWIRATTDPNDPEVRKERLEAQRQGVKPPRHPIVPPVADRPPGLMEQRVQSYLDELLAYHQPQQFRKPATLDEFDKVLSLD